MAYIDEEGLPDSVHPAKSNNILNFVAKSPIAFQIGEHSADFNSGCSVIDLIFPNMHYVEIKDISFKNYYTGWLTLKAKLKQTNINAELKWKTCVKRFNLMPDPHCEKGTEDYFIITQNMLAFELNNVASLRFVLRQTSPVWKEFRIEDIVLYKTSAGGVTHMTRLPAWITDFSKENKSNREIKGMGSVSELSANLQKIWALVELPKVPPNKFSTGRYDVEGSYEINLLSYT